MVEQLLQFNSSSCFLRNLIYVQRPSCTHQYHPYQAGENGGENKVPTTFRLWKRYGEIMPRGSRGKKNLIPAFMATVLTIALMSSAQRSCSKHRSNGLQSSDKDLGLRIITIQYGHSMNYHFCE